MITTPTTYLTQSDSYTDDDLMITLIMKDRNVYNWACFCSVVCVFVEARMPDGVTDGLWRTLHAHLNDSICSASTASTRGEWPTWLGTLMS